MTKHLRILGILFPFLLACVPALRAHTFSPTYAFNGVITATGLNPTCGTSPAPCVETVDVSFEYYYDIPSGSPFPAGNCFDSGGGVESCVGVVVLPGSTVSATGGFGPLSGSGVNGFVMLEDAFYYSPIILGASSPPNISNEIDLGLDPETNTFSSDAFSCTGECQSLFGGDGSDGAVPTTLEYTLRQLPEPSTLTLALLGILALAVLQFRRRVSFLS